MVLTKRPERMKDTIERLRWDSSGARHLWLSDTPNGKGFRLGPALKNLWLGVTVENQEMADLRIPILLQTPAAKRFVSVEPMLGPVDLEHAFSVYDQHGEPSGPRCNKDGSDVLSWVIAGSESGPHRRPCDLAWIRSLRDQCVAAGIPYFLKQMEVNGKLVKMPLLDGKVWAETPKEE